MAQAPTTRLHIEPPIDRLRLAARDRQRTFIIATGHQPTLWHPGILAKDLVISLLARQAKCSAIHVSVDHNPVGPITLDVPTRQGDSLGSRRVVFDDSGLDDRLPPNRLPPIPPGAVERLLSEIEDAAGEDIELGLAHIASAFAQAGGKPDRASQMASVLGRLKAPHLAQHQGTWSTDRVVTGRFLERLLADPVGCVRCYNRAALAYPEAGIRPLYAGRDVVEAPLWAQGRGACTPVFMDLGDSGKPQLFTQGQTLELTGKDALQYLRPRAISLSALMRSEHCDLFVHGKGGDLYDQVTERWWRDWTGQDLAPKLVVSADLYMPFDMPVATGDELARAVWFDHHLPFNVDRFVEPGDEMEASLNKEKGELLEQMNDDRDTRRRARSFRRIHAINDELGARHRDKLEAAQQRARQARAGVGNRAVAGRRDWCFALYPESMLRDLGEQISSRLAASPG